MRNVNLSLLAVFILFAASCKKEFSENQVHKETVVDVDPAKVFYKPTTQAEIQLVENLGKVTEILKELYKDKSNLKVVNASIFSKAYTDESILLKDLIYPATSRLNINKKFKLYTEKWDISLNKFSQNFWNEVNKKTDLSFIKYLNGLNVTNNSVVATNTYNEGGNNGEGTTIYYPYGEEIDPLDGESGGYYDPITTIVTATSDADQGWGNQPYYLNGMFQYYTQVLVDDNYAENNPTQIVGVNGVEPYDGPPTTNSAFPPGDPIDLPNLPREVKQVYVGDVRINGHQYDALISFTGNGGGSEIVFTRADGFLKLADGQVQADNYSTPPKEISRKNIKHGNFVDFSLEWDGDWEATNLQQNLGIYEEDNRNSSTFSANLTTTLTFPPAGGQPGVAVAAPIGFTINYKSDDAIIKQTNYNRDVFFILNRTNLEGEMKDGWPVRDRNGAVSFTLNDRTYY